MLTKYSEYFPFRLKNVNNNYDKRFFCNQEKDHIARNVTCSQYFISVFPRTSLTLPEDRKLYNSSQI